MPYACGNLGYCLDLLPTYSYFRPQKSADQSLPGKNGFHLEERASITNLFEPKKRKKVVGSQKEKSNSASYTC
jgi:hypothetical protein